MSLFCGLNCNRLNLVWKHKQAGLGRTGERNRDGGENIRAGEVRRKELEGWK